VHTGWGDCQEKTESPKKLPCARSAVKQVQMKLGLPADSYPTPELIGLLRR
jgi:hypothetical protein